MYSGVFVTAVGHTLKFGTSAKSYLGLCGVLIGVGEIVGKPCGQYINKITLLSVLSPK
jgi:hypothetical protein